MKSPIESDPISISAPSEEEISAIENHNPLHGKILRELYQARRFIWSDAIELHLTQSPKGEVVAVKVVYLDDSGFNHIAIPILPYQPQDKLEQAEKHVMSLQVDEQALFLGLLDFSKQAKLYSGITYGAMEVIRESFPSSKIVAATIGHPANFEIKIPEMQPRRVGHMISQYLLNQRLVFSTSS